MGTIRSFFQKKVVNVYDHNLLNYHFSFCTCKEKVVVAQGKKVVIFKIVLLIPLNKFYKISRRGRHRCCCETFWLLSSPLRVPNFPNWFEPHPCTIPSFVVHKLWFSAAAIMVTTRRDSGPLLEVISEVQQTNLFWIWIDAIYVEVMMSYDYWYCY